MNFLKSLLVSKLYQASRLSFVVKGICFLNQDFLNNRLCVLEDTRDPLAIQVQWLVLFCFNSLNQWMAEFQLFSAFVSGKKSRKTDLWVKNRVLHPCCWICLVFIFFIFVFSLTEALRVKPRTLCMPSTYSAAELYPPPDWVCLEVSGWWCRGGFRTKSIPPRSPLLPHTQLFT